MVSIPTCSIFTPLSVLAPICFCDKCTDNRAVDMDITSDSEEEAFAKPDSQTVSCQVQRHLQDMQSALLSWWHCITAQDFLHACFTFAVILPDPIVTTIASNCNLTTLNHLQHTLPTPWAFTEQYGEEVLELVRCVDEEERHQKEIKRWADQGFRALEAQCKALNKATDIQKSCHSQLLHHAKENCIIPGSGW